MTDVSSDQLHRAVESMHSCKATLHETVPINEQFGNQPVWQGVVHVFDVDHPEADTCYAWSSPVEGSDNRRFYAVLGKPPINSAADAVRASIVADGRGE